MDDRVNGNRQLWDPEVQAAEPAARRARADTALGAEWERVWRTPLAYYQAKFAGAGFGPDEMPPLDDIPRTTKDDLRRDEAAHPPFGTHRAVGLDAAVRMGASTGTTGRPWLIFYGQNDLEGWMAVSSQHLWRVGVRPGHRFSHSFPAGLYPNGVLAGRQFTALGAMEIPVGPPFTPEAATEHLGFWQLIGIDGLMCTGSQLQIYDDAASGAGIALESILGGRNLVLLEASCQFAGPRQRVEAAYGVTLHNIGGASEIPGFATSDCGFHRGLHVPTGHHLIQVCDPTTGREVPAGQRGTLVISAFGLDAFFLRYDVEDVVVQETGDCPCGDTGQRYTLVGRRADAADVNGRLVLPLDMQLALEEFGAPEFALATGAGDRIRVKVEGATESLSNDLSAALDLPVEVAPVERGSLGRATFKPRRIVA